MAARHYGLTLQAAEAAQRWGAGTTLVQLRPKVKCKLCGARWPNVEIEVSTPAAKMGASARTGLLTVGDRPDRGQGDGLREKTMRLIMLATVLAMSAGAAIAAPHCTKGVLCGNGCIAKGKVCHVAPHSASSFSSTGPYKGLKYVGNVGH